MTTDPSQLQLPLTEHEDRGDEDKLTFIRRREAEQEQAREQARLADIAARERALAGPVSNPKPIVSEED